MRSVEAEGETIDAAIDAALAMLGVTRDRVEIEILTNATRGLFGIGGRKARVKATLRAPIVAERPSEPARPKPEHYEVIETNHAADGVAAPVGEVDAAMVDRARQVLHEIVERIGLSAQIAMRDEGERVVLELSGDSSGILIGRRGQMLDALEYIVNRIVARDESAATRIAIDSENYRARRRTALEDLAQRMAEQAKKQRKQITLNPMSPRDRRIVHMALQADTSLTTRSSGKGYYRKLIIIPEGSRRAARPHA